MKRLDNKNYVNFFIKNQLQRLRKKINLSEEDAARKIGVSVQDYIAIEQGSKRISLDTLAQLALALNIEVSELLPSKHDAEKIRTEK